MIKSPNWHSRVSSLQNWRAADYIGSDSSFHNWFSNKGIRPINAYRNEISKNMNKFRWKFCKYSLDCFAECVVFSFVE